MKMTAAKNILKIVPMMQSVALVSENIKLVKKKKKKVKDFVGTGVKTIVGIDLIKPVASIIKGLD